MSTLSAGRPELRDRDTGQGTSVARVPLVAHIIFRLDVGGLENGLVNLINRTPDGQYRHAVICLTEYTDFKQRIQRDDVQFFALHKREGIDYRMYLNLWKLLRQLRPDIVHTRNLAAMEALAPALLAGVGRRIHGEHGREMDLGSGEWKYALLRRLFRPLVHRYIPLSRDLETWLRDGIGVPRKKISQIYNGVSLDTFFPANPAREKLPLPDFANADSLVIGTVGRLAAIKDQLTLARAFVELLDIVPDGRKRLRLAIIGDGPLMQQVKDILQKADAAQLAWLPGSLDNVPQLLRSFDIFVLPSKSEGISNTILEAMASGLPVVATRVGGNPELVVEGETGELVPSQDPAAMARALQGYVVDETRRRRHGQAGRARVEQQFSIDNMVNEYLSVYGQLLGGKQ